MRGRQNKMATKLNSVNSVNTFYVSTTLNITWMGSIQEMREDYEYQRLFFGTLEECQEELELRQNEEE